MPHAIDSIIRDYSNINTLETRMQSPFGDYFLVADEKGAKFKSKLDAFSDRLVSVASSALELSLKSDSLHKEYASKIARLLNLSEDYYFDHSTLVLKNGFRIKYCIKHEDIEAEVFGERYSLTNKPEILEFLLQYAEHKFSKTEGKKKACFSDDEEIVFLT